MIQSYQGHYAYNWNSITNWNSDDIGVYYCGYVDTRGVLIVQYVGRAIGDGGIRARLLEHLRGDFWPEVDAFGYCLCSTARDSIAFEAAEIKRLQPKYNTVGV